MCNFISSLPKNSSSESTPKFLDLWLRETGPGEIYRFRLIGFVTNNRDFPFIEKYVHEVREKGPDGKSRVVDSVVCKNTKYVKKFSNDVSKCPICQFVDKQWVAWKESGYKDKISNQKKNMFTKRYRAHILVYVVNDPNYDGNNGKLKVITLYDRDEYSKLIDMIKKASLSGISVFNGKDAVDLWMKVSKKSVVYYQGLPNERTVKFDTISDMGFSTKPYTIPTITPDLVDAFPFDQEYYTFSSNDELTMFFKKYCARPAVQVPEDDIIPSSKEPPIKASMPALKNKVKEALSNPLAVDSEDVDLSEFEKEIEKANDDIDFSESPKPSKKNVEADDDEDLVGVSVSGDTEEYEADDKEEDSVDMGDIDKLLASLDDVK